MLLYSLPYDVIQDIILFLNIIDVEKLRIAGPKDYFSKYYLEQLTENFTVLVYFYGSRNIPMPISVLKTYMDNKIGFTDLVLKGSENSIPEEYAGPLGLTAIALKYLSIPCEHTFQEHELLACSLELETLRLFNTSMKEIELPSKDHEVTDFCSVTTLDLTGCLKLQHPSKALLGFRNLTNLDVSNCHMLSDAFMNTILSTSPKLEILNMCHCNRLTDTTLLQVMAVNSIKQLGVTGCLKFSNARLKMIPQRCPNFVGFLETEFVSPTNLVKPNPNLFDKVIFHYNALLLPKMEALYKVLDPYGDAVSKFYFPVIIIQLSKPSFRNEKWYRLIFIVMTALIAWYHNFVSFMKYRDSRIAKCCSLAFLGFSVIIFFRSIWFLYWEVNEVAS